MTLQNYGPMPQMLFLQALSWRFNVIILDIPYISMHTYALPDATLPCAQSPCCFFFTGALMLLTGLYSVINAITALKSHRQWQRRCSGLYQTAYFLQKTFKTVYVSVCLSEGRGPYLSSQSFCRRIALLWNYVWYLALAHVFLVNVLRIESVDIKLYFHVDIAKIRRAIYFKLIFEMNISSRRWRTSQQLLNTRLFFWHFYAIIYARIWIGIVGYDKVDPQEHYCAKKTALCNLFIFLIILWKYDEG